ncbi:MAG: ABC transporter permease [Anaerolineae bacterium]|nr:ABC transporter permease [Anaerolineae bacterium]
MASISSEIVPKPQPSRLQRLFTTVLSVLKGLASRPLSLIGLIVVTLFILMAIFGSTVAPYKFDALIKGAARQPPSATYLFGTDKLGRDVFSRVLWGAREVITIPGVATTIAVVIGAVIGMATAYYGGWVDEIISRLLDSLLSIPALLLALVMLGVLGPSPIGIVIVIVLLYVPIVTRVIRSATLNVRNSGFIEAAKLRGEANWYILFREILPSVLPALTVEAALRFSYAIFLTASLGFLGLGVQPPSPDWGRMVNEARESYERTPWALWYPAAAIAVLVIGVNLLADGLRRIFRYEGS